MAEVIASNKSWIGPAIRCKMEGLDFKQRLMASIENERDDPEPELVEEPSPKAPPLSSPAAAGASHETADGSRRRASPNVTLTALRHGGSNPQHAAIEGPAQPSTMNTQSGTVTVDIDVLPNPTANSQHSKSQSNPEPVLALTNKEMKRKLKKEKDKERSHEIRKKRRIDNPNAQEHGKKKYIDSAVPLFKDTRIEKATVAATGYVGLGGRKSKVKKGEVHGKNKEDGGVVQPLADYSKAEAMLRELRGKKGYDLLRWNGFTSIPVSEPDGTIATVLCGHPDDSNWDAKANRPASEAMENARQSCYLPSKAQNHRRGRYAILSSGYSHGGGQTHPQNMANTKRNAKVVQELNEMDCFQRVARFVSSVFLHWAPDLHAHYENTLHVLETDDNSLKRPFQGSVFPAVTYNLGPQTVTVPHFDFANLPFGWCGITAFGNYDHTKGGHFVLPACQLIIEFPAGSTILVPSSILEHYNVPTSPHEKRYSFTQYAAGALFRWVDYGLHDAKSYENSMDKTAWKEVKERMKRNFELGLKLLPKLKLFIHLGGKGEKFKHSFRLSSTKAKT